MKTMDRNTLGAKRDGIRTRVGAIALLAVGEAVLVVASALAQTPEVRVQPLIPAPSPVVAAPASQTPEPGVPLVRYEGGLLTISADDVGLRDILIAVRNKTGANTEIPPRAEERVFIHLGPAPAREVLRSLLLGLPRFNFLLTSSATDPNRLEQILLFDRQAPTSASRPMMAASVAQWAAPHVESSAVTRSMQPEEDSEPPQLSGRDQQRQMLQQRREMITEELNRKSE
jgi:hypothetical protein